MKKIILVKGMLKSSTDTDLTKLISDYLREVGYPIEYCIEGRNCGIALKDLDYSSDVTAKNSGLVPVGGLYHTAGVVKVRLT